MVEPAHHRRWRDRHRQTQPLSPKANTVSFPPSMKFSSTYRPGQIEVLDHRGRCANFEGMHFRLYVYNM